MPVIVAGIKCTTFTLIEVDAVQGPFITEYVIVELPKVAKAGLNCPVDDIAVGEVVDDHVAPDATIGLTVIDFMAKLSQ